jgi:radical SAM protein with 4Fe4S-binding SPASM domain
MRLLPVLSEAALSSARRWIPAGMRLRAKHLISTPKPREMIIDLSATCNAQCPHCPRISMPEERSQGYMTPEVLERCLAEARQHGIGVIRLYSTAEPTLHPQFDAIVARLKREGYSVGVSTNAATLRKHMEGLAALDTLQYSIEGWDKASYEKFRYPLKFERVHRNIAEFWELVQGREIRPFISANLLLTRSTDIEAFVGCWGPYVDRITVSFLMGTTIWKDGRFVNEVNHEIGDDYFDHDVEETGVCGYPFDVVTVAYDGKIALCCEDFTAELPLGNISDGVAQVGERAALKQVRDQFYSGRIDICRGCNFFRHPRAADVEAARARIDALPIEVRRKVVLTPG